MGVRIGGQDWRPGAIHLGRRARVGRPHGESATLGIGHRRHQRQARSEALVERDAQRKHLAPGGHRLDGDDGAAEREAEQCVPPKIRANVDHGSAGGAARSCGGEPVVRQGRLHEPLPPQTLHVLIHRIVRESEGRNGRRRDGRQKLTRRAPPTARGVSPPTGEQCFSGRRVGHMAACGRRPGHNGGEQLCRSRRWDRVGGRHGGQRTRRRRQASRSAKQLCRRSRRDGLRRRRPTERRLGTTPCSKRRGWRHRLA